MVSRLPRLTRRQDFLRVARAGRNKAEPGLVLQSASQSKNDVKSGEPSAISSARVGFTASRKVGGAVRRNRAKRRLRAIADAVLPVCARADRDYVLIARHTTPDRDFAALKEDLLRALKATRSLIDPQGKS